MFLLLCKHCTNIHMFMLVMRMNHCPHLTRVQTTTSETSVTNKYVICTLVIHRAIRLVTRTNVQIQHKVLWTSSVSSIWVIFFPKWMALLTSKAVHICEHQFASYIVFKNLFANMIFVKLVAVNDEFANSSLRTVSFDSLMNIKDFNQ